MAGYVLHLTQEENIMIGAGVVRRLVEGSNGDAALLYLCLARRGSSEPEKLRAELRWEEGRYAAGGGDTGASAGPPAGSAAGPRPGGARAGIQPRGHHGQDGARHRV